MRASTASLLGVACALVRLAPSAGFAPHPAHPIAWATASRLRAAAAESGGEEATATSAPPRRARRRSSSGDRPRRPPPNRSSAPRTRPAEEGEAPKRKRAPHQFDHTKADARPFLDDPAAYVRAQDVNDDAPCYSFDDDDDERNGEPIPEGTHLLSYSLDELFPGLDFSAKFCSDADFRTEMRSAMREDVFDSTPAYSGMSEKARRMLLLPDSSLQGSWRCTRRNDDGDGDGEGELRMKKLTTVLVDRLGVNAPTGDEFMERIGSLCGSGPTTHWIDIVGITDRRISHSWHQDTGRRSPGGDARTVLLGFPKEDDYDGPGVFSHAIKLDRERMAPEDHPPGEPVVYPGLEVAEELVVRPRFAKGGEVIAFRDVDVLHSAPDVAYRASVMRFM